MLDRKCDVDTSGVPRNPRLKECCELECSECLGHTAETYLIRSPSADTELSILTRCKQDDVLVQISVDAPRLEFRLSDLPVGPTRATVLWNVLIKRCRAIVDAILVAPGERVWVTLRRIDKVVVGGVLASIAHPDNAEGFMLLAREHLAFASRCNRDQCCDNGGCQLHIVSIISTCN